MTSLVDFLYSIYPFLFRTVVSSLLMCLMLFCMKRKLFKVVENGASRSELTEFKPET